jgi:hypothetical protein
MLEAIRGLFGKKKPEPVVELPKPKPVVKPGTAAKVEPKPAAKPAAKKTTPKK